MEVPKFMLRLNAPRLPSQAKQTHKTYDHFKGQGKKAYHCEVTKELVPFFKFLGNYAHRLRLEVKYFGKFAKFTETLGNNAPISDCTKLQRLHKTSPMHARPPKLPLKLYLTGDKWY